MNILFSSEAAVKVCVSQHVSQCSTVGEQASGRSQPAWRRSIFVCKELGNRHKCREDCAGCSNIQQRQLAGSAPTSPVFCRCAS